MKFRWIVMTALVAGAMGWLAGSGFSDEEAPSADDLMEMHRQANRPGEAHAVLKRLVGTWDTAGTFWMGPGEPVTNKGVSTNHLIYGGRYLVTKYQGPWMGEEFRGMGFMGYDNATQSYQSIWIDSMSTGIAMASGSFDAESGTFTMTGSMNTPDGAVEMREVGVFRGPDTYVSTAYMRMGADAPETKMMELTMSRRKPASADCPR